MRSFVACAKTTCASLLLTFAAFQGFALLWFLTLTSGMSRVAYHGIMWLDWLTIAFIGASSGYFGAHFDRQRPIPTAVVAAALVELLHASIGAGLVSDFALQTVASVAAAAGIAALIAWLRSRRAQPPPQAE